jgi:hypothetical protein
MKRNCEAGTALCSIGVHQQNHKPLEGADRPGASWHSGSSPGPVTRVLQRFPGFAPALSPAAHSRLRQVHCAHAPARPPSRLPASKVLWRTRPNRSRPPTPPPPPPPPPTARSLPERSLSLSADACTTTARSFARARVADARCCRLQQRLMPELHGDRSARACPHPRAPCTVPLTLPHAVAK